MYLVSKYSKEEVLKIVAAHAGKSLPKEVKSGVIRASEDDDGNVDVFFIEEQLSMDFESYN